MFQIVTKLKTKMVTKLKISNYDKTQTIKLWQNQNSNIDKTKKLNRDKTQKLKLWQNSKCEKKKEKKSNFK